MLRQLGGILSVRGKTLANRESARGNIDVPIRIFCRAELLIINRG